MDVSDALRGVTCPLVTPFSDGSIDEEALDGLVDHLLAGGIDGLFPCGTTGEFASLTDAERRRVIERVADRAPADVPVVAGAGATSVDGTLAAIDDAAAAGADAAAVVHPYFHRANDPAGDRRFFDAVVADASLPLVLYNIPTCTGGAIDPDVVAAVAAHDRVIGMKDSSGDPDYVESVRERTPADFLVIQGFDAHLADSLRDGADGGINALSNVFPRAFADLYESSVAHSGTQADASDAARERADHIHEEVVEPLFERCLDHGFAPATKAALVHRGVLSAADVRPPLVSVGDDDGIERAVARATAALDAE